MGRKAFLSIFVTSANPGSFKPIILYAADENKEALSSGGQKSYPGWLSTPKRDAARSTTNRNSFDCFQYTSCAPAFQNRHSRKPGADQGFFFVFDG